MISGWLPAEQEPPQGSGRLEHVPRTRRPGVRINAKLLDGFNFEKGGGLVGGGVLEWGSHCVDLCQWAVGDDAVVPSNTTRQKTADIVARYANGVELIFRETGWIPLGSCPVRFEGETGWVEAGDSGKMVLSSPELLGRPHGRRNRRLSGDVPRPRFPRLREVAQPAQGNADAACYCAHRLPRHEHRAASGSQDQLRSAKERIHRRRPGQSSAFRSTARAVAVIRFRTIRLREIGPIGSLRQQHSQPTRPLEYQDRNHG